MSKTHDYRLLLHSLVVTLTEICNHLWPVEVQAVLPGRVGWLFDSMIGQGYIWAVNNCSWGRFILCSLTGWCQFLVSMFRWGHRQGFMVRWGLRLCSWLYWKVNCTQIWVELQASLHNLVGWGCASLLAKAEGWATFKRAASYIHIYMRLRLYSVVRQGHCLGSVFKSGPRACSMNGQRVTDWTLLKSLCCVQQLVKL